MRILTRFGATVFLCLALTGCVDDEKEDKCLEKTLFCASIPDEPDTPIPLTVEISNPAKWDSVWIELRTGDEVEKGALVEAWGVGHGGASSRTISLPEGDYCAHATYMRTGDTLETYDDDNVSREADTDECGCFLGWDVSTGSLDLKEE